MGVWGDSEHGQRWKDLVDSGAVARVAAAKAQAAEAAQEVEGALVDAVVTIPPPSPCQTIN